MDAIDITPAQRKAILALLKRHIPDVPVWAFGSRVTWTSRPESDLDLAAFSTPDQKGRISELKEAFEESDLPFRVDLLVWDELPEKFQKNIRKEHVVFVDKPEATSAMDGKAEAPMGWRIVRLGNVAEINPTRTIKRGATSAYVAMENLPIDRRTITEWNRRPFSGSGSRFQNGDTLLARITPCLENGKTAYVDCLDSGEIAHGSTEFIVLSGKDELTDSLFIYYLARSSEFRDFAIKRMEGSSGRQRVPSETLKHFEFKLPPLPTQRAIANILGTLDDLIELNRRTNETLEKIARTLFNHYFPYSPEDDLPEGWRAGTIGKICDFAYGKALKAQNRIEGTIPVYGSNGQIGQHNEALVKGPGIVVGRKGNPGVVTWIQTDFFPIDTAFYVVPKQDVGLHYLFHLLRTAQLDSLGADSAVPGLNRNMAYMSKAVIPPDNVLGDFERETSILSGLILSNDEQSRNLAALRYLLLPKLMAGEIRVMETESPSEGTSDG